MKSRILRVIALIVCGVLSAASAAGQQSSNDEVLRPVTAKTDLYPVNADAKKEIEAALKTAHAENKRVMLIFGGNWCYDCHVLDQALHEGAAARITKESFLLVHVDIGEGDKNLDLIKKYETTLGSGVPTVVIIDDEGRVIYSSTKGEFEAARQMMKKDLVAFLNQWKAPRRKPEAIKSFAQSKQSRELFPVCEKGKCGYIDRTGKVVIPLQFDEVNDFSEGLARVAAANGYGFIDKSGKFVIPPQFGLAFDFTEGLAPVSPDAMHGQWGYIDRSGKMAIAPQFKSAKNFSEGLAPVEVYSEKGLVYERASARLLSLWGYIDNTGSFVIPPQFIHAFPFTNAVARFWTGAFVGLDKYGLIDKSGKEIVEARFDNVVSDFSEGLAPFRIGKKWGFIDTTGRIVIEPRFDSARNFSEGFGRVALRNKANLLEWGFVDRGGKIIIQPQFEDTGDFSEGLAWVRPFDSKVGYVDKSGKLIVKPRFDAANIFSGGLAQVMILGAKKFVDPHGRESSAPKYGYIDKSGKFVWKPTY